MSYYKTNHPTVIQAMADFKRQREELRVAADDFAKKYGGEPVITRDLNSVRFAGLKFAPHKGSEFWTVAQAKDHLIQRPRKPRGKNYPAAEAELYEQFHADYPKLQADIDQIYVAMGTNWGNVMFAGMGFFEGVDGNVYVNTSVKLADHMTEILGSEYDTAAAALREKAA